MSSKKKKPTHRALDSFLQTWRGCTLCPLHEGRSKVVLYRGMVPCDVLFIGEAPGHVEDARGVPFVGPSGKVLESIIGECLPDELTYAITNTICCIPMRENRDLRPPKKEEIAACKPRLVDFINLVASPKAIVLVGKVAETSCRKLAESFAPAIHIRHPAYILRQGGLESATGVGAILDLQEFIATTFSEE